MMDQPGLDQNTTLQLRRLIPAPRERVFHAWTDREALQRWFRPMGEEVVVSRLEVEVGGGFCFDAKQPDGLRTVICGTYVEISFPERLIFTWHSRVTDDSETLVTIEFVERGASTEIILTHERFANHVIVARHRQGWESVLDRLQSAAFVNP
jgi:uncharacterized protein YndB with AHSA1/START domain